jgi:hypothetical protein
MQSLLLSRRDLDFLLFGHTVVAWPWLDMAITASRAPSDSDTAFYQGKLAACRFSPAE